MIFSWFKSVPGTPKSDGPNRRILRGMYKKHGVLKTFKKEGKKTKKEEKKKRREKREKGKEEKREQKKRKKRGKKEKKKRKEKKKKEKRGRKKNYIQNSRSSAPVAAVMLSSK